MDRIPLYNRYRDKIFLDRIDESWWKLCGTNFDFCRFGAKDKDFNELDFVDPSGGPFMQVDSFTFEDNKQKYILREIDSDKENIKLRFEKL